MNSTSRLVYKSCRNDGTSALKLAEIVWKNKPVTVVVLWFLIYEAGNFWNSPRNYSGAAKQVEMVKACFKKGGK